MGDATLQALIDEAAERLSLLEAAVADLVMTQVVDDPLDDARPQVTTSFYRRPVTAAKKPAVGGYDAHHAWHDPGSGEFAHPGVDTAKALIEEAFHKAIDHAKGNPDGVWLKTKDKYLSRIGVGKGEAVKVKYLDDTNGLIDVVKNGKHIDKKVAWKRFDDNLPDDTIKRIDTPTFTGNTTSKAAGKGLATATRIQGSGDAGGWGEVSDSYLNKFGIAKGDVINVRYLDDKHAVITDSTGTERTVSWSRFTDRIPTQNGDGTFSFTEPTPIPTAAEAPVEFPTGAVKTLKDLEDAPVGTRITHNSWNNPNDFYEKQQDGKWVQTDSTGHEYSSDTKEFATDFGGTKTEGWSFIPPAKTDGTAATAKELDEAAPKATDNFANGWTSPTTVYTRHASKYLGEFTDSTGTVLPPDDKTPGTWIQVKAADGKTQNFAPDEIYATEQEAKDAAKALKKPPTKKEAATLYGDTADMAAINGLNAKGEKADDASKPFPEGPVTKSIQLGFARTGTHLTNDSLPAGSFYEKNADSTWTFHHPNGTTLDQPVNPGDLQLGHGNWSFVKPDAPGTGAVPDAAALSGPVGSVEALDTAPVGTAVKWHTWANNDVYYQKTADGWQLYDNGKQSDSGPLSTSEFTGPTGDNIHNWVFTQPQGETNPPESPATMSPMSLDFKGVGQNNTGSVLDALPTGTVLTPGDGNTLGLSGGSTYTKLADGKWEFHSTSSEGATPIVFDGGPGFNDTGPWDVTPPAGTPSVPAPLSGPVASVQALDDAPVGTRITYDGWKDPSSSYYQKNSEGGWVSYQDGQASAYPSQSQEFQSNIGHWIYAPPAEAATPEPAHGPQVGDKVPWDQVPVGATVNSFYVKKPNGGAQTTNGNDIGDGTPGSLHWDGTNFDITALPQEPAPAGEPSAFKVGDTVTALADLKELPVGSKYTWNGNNYAVDNQGMSHLYTAEGSYAGFFPDDQHTSMAQKWGDYPPAVITQIGPDATSVTPPTSGKVQSTSDLIDAPVGTTISDGSYSWGKTGPDEWKNYKKTGLLGNESFPSVDFGAETNDWHYTPTPGGGGGNAPTVPPVDTRGGVDISPDNPDAQAQLDALPVGSIGPGPDGYYWEKTANNEFTLHGPDETGGTVVDNQEVLGDPSGPIVHFDPPASSTPKVGDVVTADELKNLPVGTEFSAALETNGKPGVGVFVVGQPGYAQQLSDPYNDTATTEFKGTFSITKTPEAVSAQPSGPQVGDAIAHSSDGKVLLDSLPTGSQIADSTGSFSYTKTPTGSWTPDGTTGTYGAEAFIASSNDYNITGIPGQEGGSVAPDLSNPKVGDKVQGWDQIKNLPAGTEITYGGGGGYATKWNVVGDGTLIGDGETTSGTPFDPTDAAHKDGWANLPVTVTVVPGQSEGFRAGEIDPSNPAIAGKQLTGLPVGTVLATSVDSSGEWHKDGPDAYNWYAHDGKPPVGPPLNTDGLLADGGTLTPKTAAQPGFKAGDKFAYNDPGVQAKLDPLPDGAQVQATSGHDMGKVFTKTGVSNSGMSAWQSTDGSTSMSSKGFTMGGDTYTVLHTMPSSSSSSSVGTGAPLAPGTPFNTEADAANAPIGTAIKLVASAGNGNYFEKTGPDTWMFHSPDKASYETQDNGFGSGWVTIPNPGGTTSGTVPTGAYAVGDTVGQAQWSSLPEGTVVKLDGIDASMLRTPDGYTAFQPSGHVVNYPASASPDHKTGTIPSITGELPAGQPLKGGPSKLKGLQAVPVGTDVGLTPNEPAWTKTGPDQWEHNLSGETFDSKTLAQHDALYITGGTPTPAGAIDPTAGDAVAKFDALPVGSKLHHDGGTGYYYLKTGDNTYEWTSADGENLYSTVTGPELLDDGPALWSVTPPAGTAPKAGEPSVLAPGQKLGDASAAPIGTTVRYDNWAPDDPDYFTKVSDNGWVLHSGGGEQTGFGDVHFGGDWTVISAPGTAAPGTAAPGTPLNKPSDFANTPVGTSIKGTGLFAGGYYTKTGDNVWAFHQPSGTVLDGHASDSTLAYSNSNFQVFDPNTGSGPKVGDPIPDKSNPEPFLDSLPPGTTVKSDFGDNATFTKQADGTWTDNSDGESLTSDNFHGWSGSVDALPAPGSTTATPTVGDAVSPDNLANLPDGTELADYQGGNGYWVKHAEGMTNTYNGNVHEFSSIGGDTYITALPATPTAPVPETAPPSKMELPSLSGNTPGWKKIGGQGGSNPGGMFQQESTGDKFYVKDTKSPDHAAQELAANNLYQAAGVRVPEVAGDQHSPTLIASKVEDGTELGSTTKGAVADKVRDDFVVDAWLANWDVVGQGGDNIKIVGGEPVRIDSGGSLEYRAQGAPKGTDFGNKVTELESLRGIGTSGSKSKAQQLFASTTPEQMTAGAEKVASVSPDQIRQIVKDAGGKDSLADTLIARRADIIQTVLHKDPAEYNVPEVGSSIDMNTGGVKALDALPVGSKVQPSVVTGDIYYTKQPDGTWLYGGHDALASSQAHPSSDFQGGGTFTVLPQEPSTPSAPAAPPVPTAPTPPTGPHAQVGEVVSSVEDYTNLPVGTTVHSDDADQSFTKLPDGTWAIHDEFGTYDTSTGGNPSDIMGGYDPNVYTVESLPTGTPSNPVTSTTAAPAPGTVITTIDQEPGAVAAQLDALPVGSIIKTDTSDPLIKQADGTWKNTTEPNGVVWSASQFNGTGDWVVQPAPPTAVATPGAGAATHAVGDQIQHAELDSLPAGTAVKYTVSGYDAKPWVKNADGTWTYQGEAETKTYPVTGMSNSGSWTVASLPAGSPAATSSSGFDAGHLMGSQDFAAAPVGTVIQNPSAEVDWTKQADNKWLATGKAKSDSHPVDQFLPSEAFATAPGWKVKGTPGGSVAATHAVGDAVPKQQTEGVPFLNDLPVGTTLSSLYHSDATKMPGGSTGNGYWIDGNGVISPGQIVGSGSYNVSNLPGGEPVHTVGSDVTGHTGDLPVGSTVQVKGNAPGPENTYTVSELGLTNPNGTIIPHDLLSAIPFEVASVPAAPGGGHNVGDTITGGTSGLPVGATLSVHGNSPDKVFTVADNGITDPNGKLIPHSAVESIPFDVQSLPGNEPSGTPQVGDKATQTALDALPPGAVIKGKNGSMTPLTKGADGIWTNGQGHPISTATIEKHPYVIDSTGAPTPQAGDAVPKFDGGAYLDSLPTGSTIADSLDSFSYTKSPEGKWVPEPGGGSGWESSAFSGSNSVGDYKVTGIPGGTTGSGLNDVPHGDAGIAALNALPTGAKIKDAYGGMEYTKTASGNWTDGINYNQPEAFTYDTAKFSVVPGSVPKVGDMLPSDAGEVLDGLPTGSKIGVTNSSISYTKMPSGQWLDSTSPSGETIEPEAFNGNGGNLYKITSTGEAPPMSSADLSKVPGMVSQDTLDGTPVGSKIGPLSGVSYTKLSDGTWQPSGSAPTLTVQVGDHVPVGGTTSDYLGGLPVGSQVSGDGSTFAKNADGSWYGLGNGSLIYQQDQFNAGSFEVTQVGPKPQTAVPNVGDIVHHGDMESLAPGTEFTSWGDGTGGYANTPSFKVNGNGTATYIGPDDGSGFSPGDTQPLAKFDPSDSGGFKITKAGAEAPNPTSDVPPGTGPKVGDQVKTEAVGSLPAGTKFAPPGSPLSWVKNDDGTVSMVEADGTVGGIHSPTTILQPDATFNVISAPSTQPAPKIGDVPKTIDELAALPTGTKLSVDGAINDWVKHADGQWHTSDKATGAEGSYTVDNETLAHATTEWAISDIPTGPKVGDAVPLVGDTVTTDNFGLLPVGSVIKPNSPNVKSFTKQADGTWQNDAGIHPYLPSLTDGTNKVESVGPAANTGSPKVGDKLPIEQAEGVAFLNSLPAGTKLSNSAGYLAVTKLPTGEWKTEGGSTVGVGSIPGHNGYTIESLGSGVGEGLPVGQMVKTKEQFANAPAGTWFTYGAGGGDKYMHINPNNTYEAFDSSGNSIVTGSTTGKEQIVPDLTVVDPPPFAATLAGTTSGTAPKPGDVLPTNDTFAATLDSMAPNSVIKSTKSGVEYTKTADGWWSSGTGNDLASTSFDPASTQWSVVSTPAAPDTAPVQVPHGFAGGQLLEGLPIGSKIHKTGAEPGAAFADYEKTSDGNWHSYDPQTGGTSALGAYAVTSSDATWQVASTESPPMAYYPSTVSGLKVSQLAKETAVADVNAHTPNALQKAGVKQVAGYLDKNGLLQGKSSSTTGAKINVTADHVVGSFGNKLVVIPESGNIDGKSKQLQMLPAGSTFTRTSPGGVTTTYKVLGGGMIQRTDAPYEVPPAQWNAIPKNSKIHVDSIGTDTAIAVAPPEHEVSSVVPDEFFGQSVGKEAAQKILTDQGATHVTGWVNADKLHSSGSNISIHPEKPSSGNYVQQSIPVNQIVNTTKSGKFSYSPPQAPDVPGATSGKVTVTTTGVSNDPAVSGVPFSYVTPHDNVATSERFNSVKTKAQAILNNTGAHSGGVHSIISSWQSSSNDVRVATRALIAGDDPVPVSASAQHLAEGAAFMQILHDSPTIDKTLYRGGRMFPTDVNNLIEASKNGDTVDIPLGPFTYKKSFGESNANSPIGGHTNGKSERVVLVMDPGAKGIDFQDKPWTTNSMESEEEVVTGARVKVKKVWDSGGIHYVQIEQLDTPNMGLTSPSLPAIYPTPPGTPVGYTVPGSTGAGIPDPLAAGGALDPLAAGAGAGAVADGGAAAAGGAAGV